MRNKVVKINYKRLKKWSLLVIKIADVAFPQETRLYIERGMRNKE